MTSITPLIVLIFFSLIKYFRVKEKKKQPNLLEDGLVFFPELLA